MWQSELVADGLAFCICCVQTGGFVLLSPGEDRAFLLASRFLSVGATKENICGMQGRETGERREREKKKNWQKHWQTPLALNVPAHCLLCIVYSGRKHGDTSAQLLHLALAPRRLLRKQVPAFLAVSVRDTELIHYERLVHMCEAWCNTSVQTRLPFYQVVNQAF